ncbi:putative transcriptional regulator [Alteromonadaceae bacterium 2753L.S.0a.02]|nr:putative transcriptional regulator [Alteromonadaceae bacterium 2753L.S.0a.02]
MKIPTPSELEILEILWRLGEGSAQTVNDVLNEKKPVSYTGTLKLMQLMYQKGLLTRRKEGRSHTYMPTIEESQAKSSLLDRFVETTFGGSAANLVMQLLGNKKVSKKELQNIREYLDNMENKKK